MKVNGLSAERDALRPDCPPRRGSVVGSRGKEGVLKDGDHGRVADLGDARLLEGLHERREDGLAQGHLSLEPLLTEDQERRILPLPIGLEETTQRELSRRQTETLLESGTSLVGLAGREIGPSEVGVSFR